MFSFHHKHLKLATLDEDVLSAIAFSYHATLPPPFQDSSLAAGIR